MEPDHKLLSVFGVSAAHHVAETPIANIWRVMQTNGTLAALKIYKNGDLQDEALGFDVLAAAAGTGAVRIHARRGAAVLMEWLDGPSLGDLVRAGDDDTASRQLVATANTLHGADLPDLVGLDPLPNRFRALLDARFSPDCPTQISDTILQASRLAARLLDQQTDIRPLHGDLHHDNIKQGPRGYVSLDAKGVLGEPTFELANAFRNPLGAEALYQSRDVVMRRAKVWADGFGVEQAHLIRWAAAYSALSLVWTHKGVFDAGCTDDVRFVDTLLSCAAQ